MLIYMMEHTWLMRAMFFSMCYEHQPVGVYPVIIMSLSRYYHLTITLSSRYYTGDK